MIEHVPRWLKSSIAKHFNDNKGDLVLVVEGTDDKAVPQAARIELRIEGPNIRTITKNQLHISCTVGLLVATPKNPVDVYDHERYVGLMVEQFITIPIMKLGTGVSDDQTVIECLQRDDEILVMPFGFVKNSPALFTSIEADYQMHLELEE